MIFCVILDYKGQQDIKNGNGRMTVSRGLFGSNVFLVLLFSWLEAWASSFVLTSTSTSSLVRRLPSPEDFVHSRTRGCGSVHNNNHSFHDDAADDDDDEEEEDEEDDEPPEVDIRNFRYKFLDENNVENGNRRRTTPGPHEETEETTAPSSSSAPPPPPTTTPAFGLGRGRSSPLQRKAMGGGGTNVVVHICQNCGSESVKWLGRCPTCKAWNTFQETTVQRSSSSSSSSRKSQAASSGAPPGGFAHNLLKTGGQRGRSGGDNFGSSSSSSSSSNSDAIGQSWLTDTAPSFDYSNTNTNLRAVSIADIDLHSGGAGHRMRIPHDEELTTVLGGGLLPGSLILLGGDPGVGKSTLALQMAAHVANTVVATTTVGIGMGPTNNTKTKTNPAAIVGPVWYVSGEETMEQIATRAQRLIQTTKEPATATASEQRSSSGSSTRRTPSRMMTALPKELYLLSETNLNVITEEVLQLYLAQAQYTQQQQPQQPQEARPPAVLPPSLIVIDSIQTMVCEAGGASSAGGITQVRESMALLLRLAKTTQIPIVTIGHVTKTGDVAGPRMVEHMVDAVLYLEHSQAAAGSASSPSHGNFRWLRGQKNRFGSCQNVGLYDFQEGILIPLPEGTEAASAVVPPADDLEGSAMGVCVEGPHRAMTVEVQALVTEAASSSFGKKTVEGGVSGARLNLLLGILQKHCQLPIAGSGRIGRDVYVNVVGCEGTVSKSQLSLATMSLDLAVAVALTSSYLRIPARGDTACLAQVGLLGELRPLSSLEPRLLQAQRMGFSSVIVAADNQNRRQRRRKSKDTKYNTGGSSSSRNDNVDDELPIIRSTRKHGLDIYECSTLKQALNVALVSPIPSRSKSKSNNNYRQRQYKNNSNSSNTNIIGRRKTSPAAIPPGSLHDLNLEDEEIIIDDDDDDVEDDEDFF